MANKWTTQELLDIAAGRILQGMGIPNPTYSSSGIRAHSSNRIGGAKFTTPNAEGDVCNTNSFKLKALLYAAAHVHSEIIAEHPELYHEGDNKIAGAYGLAESMVAWTDESLAKMYFSAEIVEK